jgi:hypothetical protein
VIHANTDTYITKKNGNIENSTTMISILGVPFLEPPEGQLVLTRKGKKYEFKVVEAISGKYIKVKKNGVIESIFIPHGFLFLKSV